MANEISHTTSLTASKAGVSVAGSATKINDMAGDQMVTIVQIIGTAAEALTLTDVATLGFLRVRNMDPTNYVQIATDASVSTGIFARLLPGQSLLIPTEPTTATYYAKAAVANCNVEIQAVEL